MDCEVDEMSRWFECNKLDVSLPFCEHHGGNVGWLCSKSLKSLGDIIYVFHFDFGKNIERKAPK